MSKAPPELTWQDKAILVVIPIVVFVIFILANYVSKDLTVSDAFEQKLPKAQVRDAGTIIELSGESSPGSHSVQLCRLRSRDGLHDFTFQYNIQGSDTMKLEVGRLMQFFGEYKFDAKGGILEVPFKGKSGRMSGWAVYENRRYYAHADDKSNDL
ncbi:MAG: DUF3465 domain-containing protein [Candidatus Riflebacteria bacterium]|nr:DUF3465 domain-containing protein [Candidatus Riflebacteria bacterium]